VSSDVSGKSEVSSVVYKVGESMQELIKLWKEYELSQSQVEKNGESSNSGPTFEIRIPAENVTATNRQVRSNSVNIKLRVDCICGWGLGESISFFVCVLH